MEDLYGLVMTKIKNSKKNPFAGWGFSFARFRLEVVLESTMHMCRIWPQLGHMWHVASKADTMWMKWINHAYVNGGCIGPSKFKQLVKLKDLIKDGLDTHSSP